MSMVVGSPSTTFSKRDVERKRFIATRYRSSTVKTATPSTRSHRTIETRVARGGARAGAFATRSVGCDNRMDQASSKCADAWTAALGPTLGQRDERRGRDG